MFPISSAGGSPTPKAFSTHPGLGADVSTEDKSSLAQTTVRSAEAPGRLERASFKTSPLSSNEIKPLLQRSIQVITSGHDSAPEA